jgi:hypothetical protein
MHLHIAEQIRAQAGGNGRLPDMLSQFWPAFYLGSVAADCQELAGLSREATHFYGMPPQPDNRAYPRMLAAYPELADSRTLAPAHAVFVAAYSVHLMYDLLWFRDILMPFFAHPQTWSPTFEERRLVHQTLLTYLDKLAYEALPETAVSTLSAASPDHWLPFVPDDVLRQWQSLLVRQLEPSGELETVKVYAARLGIKPAEFAANLSDPQWMEQHVFQVVPVTEIQTKLETAVADSLLILHEYLQM